MKKLLNYSINENKKISYVLQSIYGIGYRVSLNICKKYNLNPNLKWNELNSNTHFAITNYLEKQIPIGKDVKSLKKQNIEKYIKNKSTRGFRHLKHLPLRGQRTHSNAKTMKKLFKSSKKK